MQSNEIKTKLPQEIFHTHRIYYNSYTILQESDNAYGKKGLSLEAEKQGSRVLSPTVLAKGEMEG